MGWEDELRRAGMSDAERRTQDERKASQRDQQRREQGRRAIAQALTEMVHVIDGAQRRITKYRVTVGFSMSSLNRTLSIHAPQKRSITVREEGPLSIAILIDGKPHDKVTYNMSTGRLQMESGSSVPYDWQEYIGKQIVNLLS